jgi:hypothetical protein
MISTEQLFLEVSQLGLLKERNMKPPGPPLSRKHFGRTVIAFSDFASISTVLPPAPKGKKTVMIILPARELLRYSRHHPSGRQPVFHK